MARRQLFIPLSILLVAALLRLALLDLKPPHFDEGINGWWCDEMAKKGYYAYDPTNYHGPLHFYVLFGFLKAFGRNLWALRMPTVLLGIATVGLTLGFRKRLGGGVATLAALALTVSPAYVFYQRYSIHETWLALFLILAYWALCRLCAGRDRRATACLVAAGTGLVLTKETYIIHGAAAFLAGALLILDARWRQMPVGLPWRRFDRQALLLSGGVGAFLIVFFYSGTFRDPEGLAGLFQTFAPWTKTGIDAAGHGKADYDLFAIVPRGLATIGPFTRLASFKLNWYWVKLFTVYEWFTLAGLVASPFWWFHGRRAFRFLSFYGWFTLLAYSLIPYKTPWCVISIAWPFTFLAAAAFVHLGRRSRWWAVAPVAAVLLGHDAYRMWRLNFREYDDPRQMYAYVQTYRDYRAFVDPILREASLHPGLASQLKGNVLLSSYFPIPWVLGDFPRVGYYNKDEAWPKKLDADFLVVEDSLTEEVKDGLTESYFEKTFRLRDGMGLCRAFFRYDRFKDLYPQRPPDFIPEQVP